MIIEKTMGDKYYKLIKATLDVETDEIVWRFEVKTDVDNETFRKIEEIRKPFTQEEFNQIFV